MESGGEEEEEEGWSSGGLTGGGEERERVAISSLMLISELKLSLDEDESSSAMMVRTGEWVDGACAVRSSSVFPFSSFFFFFLTMVVTFF